MNSFGFFFLNACAHAVWVVLSQETDRITVSLREIDKLTRFRKSRSLRNNLCLINFSCKVVQNMLPRR